MRVKCPIDGETLAITSREGVEIDYCPTCRGVWLDRGELDKILDRGRTEMDASRDRYQDERRPQQPQYRSEHDPRASYARPKKKKRHFLEDLFEFD